MTQETMARWAALPRLAAVVLVAASVWFDRFSAPVFSSDSCVLGPGILIYNTGFWLSGAMPIEFWLYRALPVAVAILIVLDASGVRRTRGTAIILVFGVIVVGLGQAALREACTPDYSVSWALVISYALAIVALLIAGRLPLTMTRPATREVICWSLGTAAAAWWTISYLFVPEYTGDPAMDPSCCTTPLDLWWRIQQFHYEAQVMGLHLGPLAVIATMTFLVSRRAAIAASAGLLVLAVLGTIAAIANPYQFCYEVAMSPLADTSWPLIAAAILIRLPTHTTFLSRLTPSKNTRDLLAILAVAVILGWLVVAHFLS